MCDGSMEVLASIASHIVGGLASDAAETIARGLAAAGCFLQASHGFVLQFLPAGEAWAVFTWQSTGETKQVASCLNASASWWQEQLGEGGSIEYCMHDAAAEPLSELQRMAGELGCDAFAAKAWGDQETWQGAVVFAAVGQSPEWASQHSSFISSLTAVLGAAVNSSVMGMATKRRREWRLMGGISNAAGELLTTTDIEGSISRALAELGNAAQVDRVYVFEDYIDPLSGAACSTRTYEWTAAGISAQLDNPQTHNVPHSGPMRRVFEALARGEPVMYFASKLTPDEASILAPQSIQSMLNVPIWVDGRVWGFLGVDDCQAERVWSDGEVAFFGTVASMIGNAVARMRIKLALIESEERFRLAFDYSAAGMAISDPSMRLLRANLAYCQMVGYSAAELARIGIAGITHPDDLAAEQASFKAAFAGEISAFSRDKRYIHKNGRIIWAHLSAALLRDTKGEPSYLIGQVIDITERKQAERALRISEQRFRHLAEGVADIIWTADAQGRFTYCTPAVNTILGYTQEEVLHQERRQLMHPDDVEQAEVSLQELLVKQQPYRHLEFKLLHKDGHEVVLESSADPIFDHSGAFIGFHGIDRDITVWKQAQAERERLIEELSRAVAEIETLHGLLPICSGCKKIRDDHNNWTAIDQYISQRSDINFTHSLCPDCLRTLYPDLFSGMTRRED